LKQGNTSIVERTYRLWIASYCDSVSVIHLHTIMCHCWFLLTAIAPTEEV